MSEPNLDTPLPDQESGSKIADKSAMSNVKTTVIESEKSENTQHGISKIAKPTGMKFSSVNSSDSATRIDRLCNNVSKPAIPSHPAKNVDEARENTVPFYGNEKWMNDRKMSSGSALSDSSRKSDELRKKRFPDASASPDSYSDYWKSEFEPRRASDASVVLTEDTDQFIIGDRVWVGGMKPGQIAYIGETQFAPGEWAGVVLDEPIGKNDGTVANIRYFQCEPKKGIFSRLTRLTRYPLVEGGAGEPAASRPVPADNKRNGSLVTSVPKKSSLVLQPSSGLKNSLSKPPSPDSSLHPNFQIGDRVIVKSSQGSKAGILRYLGATDFAAGEWCGVELDDPLGKNDGSVSGTRYFECRPKFGLFAPLHKVSKSPANKRPSQGNCVIHNRSGANTSGIRRQGSKESLTSLSSTASTAVSTRSAANRKIGARTPSTPTSAKNVLQETLKEKELHIEQLLKERDLERAEVTRAASQADEAERRLVVLKQEFEQQKEEAEARVSDLDSIVRLLKAENEELKNLLDDERKKYEDLQFRFEEETIETADLKSMTIKYEENAKLLEKALSEERKKIEVLEQESNKLFEAEELTVVLKDELDSAKEEIAQLKKMRSALEQEHISLEAHLTSSRAELESLKIENEFLKTSASQDQKNFRENLEKTIEAFEASKKELEQKEKESAAKDLNSLEKEKEIHAKYLKIINELTEKHKTESENLTHQIEESKNTSEKKLKLFEEQLEEKLKMCSSLETQLNEVNILLSKTVAERSFEQSNKKAVVEKLQMELREISEKAGKKEEQLIEEITKNEKFFQENQRLKEKVAEMQKLVGQSSEAANQRMTELNEIIGEQKKELEKIKALFESESKKCEFLKGALATSEKEKGERLEEMNMVIKEKHLEVEKLREEIQKQREDFELIKKELEQANDAHEESFKAKIKILEDAEADRKREVEMLSKDLQNVANSLMESEKQLKREQIDNEKLAEKLRILEENFEKLSKEKDKKQFEVSDMNRKFQFMEEKLLQVTQQKNKLESDISNFISTSNDSSLQLAKLNEDLRSKEKELDSFREEFSQKTHIFERTEQELKQALEKKEVDLSATKEELEKTKQNYQLEIATLQNKLKDISARSSATELDWKKKSESLKEDSELRVRNLEEQIRLLENREVENKKKYETNLDQLNKAREELTTKLAEAKAAEAMHRDSLEKKLEDLNVEKNNLLQSVERTKTEFLNSERQMTEEFKKNAESLASESEKLRHELKETTDRLAKTAEELVREKEEKKKLNQEKSSLEKKEATTEELLKKLQENNRVLEVNVTSVGSENKILKSAVEQLREEKCLLNKDVTEKMLQLTELRSQFEALESFIKTREAENEVKVQSLEAETSELKSKLFKVETSHSVAASEKSKQVAELINELDRLKRENSQIMLAKEKDANNVNAILRQLKDDFEESKSESEKKSGEMQEMKKLFEKVKEELESERKKSEEYEKLLSASETERLDLKAKCEERSKFLIADAEIKNQLAHVQQKLYEAEEKQQETVKSTTYEKENLKKMLETVNGLLSQKEKEAKAMSKEIEALSQEKLNLVNGNRTLVEALEKENTALRKQLEEHEKAQAVSRAENVGQDELQEERDFQKGQVDFLNSVIVDMQKKNDALKARIEILEMGFSPADVDEFDFHKITTKSVAPRLFCDICDRFDLHDTEDCPTQANEDVPPPKFSKAKIPPPERPYCEICEVFGHDTANCDDGETF